MEKGITLWVITILYSFSLPFTRPLLNYVRGHNIDVVVIAKVLIVIIAAAVIYYILFYKKEKRVTVYINFIILCFISYYVFKREGIEFPVEKIHIAQYLILSWLVFLSVSFYVPDISAYFWSAAVCFLVGVLDETVQGLVPKRYFDYNDILLNFKITVIGHAGIFFVLKLHESFKETGVFCKKIYLLFLSAAANFIYIIYACILFTEGKNINENAWKSEGYHNFSNIVVISGIIFVIINIILLLLISRKKEVITGDFRNGLVIISSATDFIILLIVIGKMSGIPFG